MTPICKYKKGRKALHINLCTTGTLTSFNNLFSYTEATAVLTTGPKIPAIFKSHYNLKPWTASKLLYEERGEHSLDSYLHQLLHAFYIPNHENYITRSNCKHWNKNYFKIFFSLRPLNYLYSTPAFLSVIVDANLNNTMTILFNQFIYAQSSERHICLF